MKKILVLLAYILFNLVFFEVFLSFFDPEEVLVKGYDKKLLFSLYPNRVGMVVSKEYKVMVETNSFGFRQKGVEKSKPEILVLGDSFTEGWGVEEKDIYLTIINKEQGFQHRNLGLHGSSPLLYAIQLPHYIEMYNPKKVILQLFDNDLDDNDKIAEFVEFDQEGRPIGHKFRLGVFLLGEWGYNFLKETTLYRLGSRVVKILTKTPSPILYYKLGKEPNELVLTHEQSLAIYGRLKPLGNDVHTKYSGQFEFYKDPNSSIWKKRLEKNIFYLKIISNLCKSKNIELEILYIPAKEFFAKGGILGDCLDCNLEKLIQKNPHESSLVKFTSQEKIPFYSVSRIFWDKNPEDLYFPYDAHLNPKGHKELAMFFLRKK